MVCPYTWEVPGGVQEHVKDLAEALIGLGHEVSVITPADDDTPLPDYVVPAGRAIPVPYNGVRRAARFRLRLRRPGPPVGQGGRVRRAARARASRAQPVPARLLGRGRADRRDRAHRQPPFAGDARRLFGTTDRAGEDQRLDRGVRGGPDHPGGAHGRRRGADPERGDGEPVREGRPAARLARHRRGAGLPGPDGRAAQGPERAAAGVRTAGQRAARAPAAGCRAR